MNLKKTLALSLPVLVVACTTATPNKQELTFDPKSLQDSKLQQSQLEIKTPKNLPGKAQILPEGKTEKVVFKLDMGKGFKTQVVTPADLAFIKLSLVGSGITGNLTNDGNAFVAVTGGTATAAISNVPISAGQIRVVTVQGYNAAQQALPSFVGKGYYKSSAGTTTITITINRRQLLTGLVLENLINAGSPLANTIDTAALQASIDTSTGFNSTTNTFVVDPTKFDPAKVATLLTNNNGTVPTTTEINTNSAAVAVNVKVYVKTTAGGNFNEAVTITIDDPDSTAQTVATSSTSPANKTILTNPGTWNVYIKNAGGTILAQTTVTVDTNGGAVLTTGNVGTPITLNVAEATAIPAGGSVTCGGDLNKVYTISTVAGTGSAGSTGNGGPATAATLGNLRGVTLDSSGAMYVLDNQNHQIRKVDSAGIITLFGGTTAGSAGDGGAATAAQFNNMWGMNIDSGGNVYISEPGNDTVRKIDTAGIVNHFAGVYTTPSSTGNGGPATGAGLNEPIDVEFDHNGNLYVADWQNHAIRKIDTAGNMTVFAGTLGTSGSSGMGGPATAARLNNPFGLAFDSGGNLYVSQWGNRIVTKVDTAGVITTVAGTQSVGGSGGDGGPATAANLSSNASGLIADAAGNLIIADASNHAIRLVDSAGNIKTIAGTINSAGSGGDGGPATSAQLNTPYGITCGGGNIYVADSNNRRIRKLTPAP